MKRSTKRIATILLSIMLIVTYMIPGSVFADSSFAQDGSDEVLAEEADRATEEILSEDTEIPEIFDEEISDESSPDVSEEEPAEAAEEEPAAEEAEEAPAAEEVVAEEAVEEAPAAAEEPAVVEEPVAEEAPAAAEEPAAEEEAATPTEVAEIEEETVEEEALEGASPDDYVVRADGTIIEYNGTSTSITLPLTVKGVAVKRLSEAVFANNKKILNVTLPDSIMVDAGAFRNCTSLLSVSMHNSIDTISAECFEGCTALLTVSWPENLKTIEHDAFKGCTSLTGVPSGTKLETLGDNAFQGCTALTYADLDRDPRQRDRAGQPCFRRLLCRDQADPVQGRDCDQQLLLQRLQQHRRDQYPLQCG